MERELINILFADDDETDLKLLIDAFEELKMGTTVHAVHSGIELIEYLTNHENSLPKIIFLDLNMPRKSGLDCLKEIRANEKYKAISIAIYSNSAAEKDIKDTFLNGANVFITKPSDFNLLKEVLAKVVSASTLHQASQFKMENFILKV